MGPRKKKGKLKIKNEKQSFVLYKRFVVSIPTPQISISCKSKKQGRHIGGEKEVACNCHLGEVLPLLLTSL